MSEIVLVHLSDIHFGRDADLDQIEALHTLLPTMPAQAIVVSGDLTQRARHGEMQAAHLFLKSIRPHAPQLVIPGNHDVQWWQSPFGIRGSRVKYTKFVRYFGPDVTPVLEIPGAVIASVLTAHGLSLGSLTWNPNDTTVKGHLPASEVARVTEIFRRAPAGAARVLVVHHNVLRGQISRRMGLARWRTAQRRLLTTGADVVLCGHDHEEAAGQIDGVLPVSTASTHTARVRGHQPSAFNLVRIAEQHVQIEHYRWDAAQQVFRGSDVAAFARGASAQSLAAR